MNTPTTLEGICNLKLSDEGRPNKKGILKERPVKEEAL